jgi:hypothetical protein
MAAKAAPERPDSQTREVAAVITSTPARQRSVLDTPYSHECHHGFCSVCGSVWPCSRAQRTAPRHTIPIARVEYLDH